MRERLSRLVRGHLFNMVAAVAITVLLLQEATRSITESREVVIRARFVPSSERMLVSPAEVFPVTCTIVGTASHLRRFESEVPALVDLPAGAGDVPGTAGSWPIAERLRDYIGAQLPASEVTIESAQPPPSVTTLTITDLIERSVDLVLQPGEGIRGATVEGSASQVLLVPPDLATAALSLEVRVSGLDRPPGAYQEELLPKVIGLPATRAAECRGLRPVRVAYSIVAASRELTLSRVPVQVAALPDTLARYVVSIPSQSQFIADVVVKGPPDAITLLESNAFKPIAIVHLTHEELVGKATSGIVDFWLLPKGVNVVSVGGSTETQPSVNLEIAPAAAAAGFPLTTPPGN